MPDYLSSLKLCSNELFARTTQPFEKERIFYPQWFVENVKQGAGVVTERIYDCVSPCFANSGVNGTLQHICPNSEGLSKLETGKYLLDRKLKDCKKFVNALLVGGTNSEKSKKVINSLVEYCQENKIPQSKLLFHKNTSKSGTNLAYKASSNEFIISNDEITQFLSDNRLKFFKMPKEELRPELEKFLNQHYDEVDVKNLDLVI